jgi:hypothetical protein
MSYGIGIVIPKEDLVKEKIRFSTCDWMLPIHVKLYPEQSKKNFLRWFKEFETETQFTTLDKLKTAPCDCVCIIDSEGNFSILEGHEPINCAKGSGNEHLGDVKEYLTGIKEK